MLSLLFCYFLSLSSTFFFQPPLTSLCLPLAAFVHPISILFFSSSFICLYLLLITHYLSFHLSYFFTSTSITCFLPLYLYHLFPSFSLFKFVVTSLLYFLFLYQYLQLFFYFTLSLTFIRHPSHFHFFFSSLPPFVWDLPTHRHQRLLYLTLFPFLSCFPSSITFFFSLHSFSFSRLPFPRFQTLHPFPVFSFCFPFELFPF